MYNEPLTPLYGNRPPRRSHKKHNMILALSALVVPISLCVASTTANANVVLIVIAVIIILGAEFSSVASSPISG
jgi:hypothetical protein